MEYLDIVFTVPPGPESSEFVEVEDSNGKSVRLGEWKEREDGYWVLRFTTKDVEDLLREVNNK